MSITEDLVRSGWFVRTAKALVKTVPTVDWQDVAQEGAITAMRAERTFNPTKSTDMEHEVWVKFRARYRMQEVRNKQAKPRDIPFDTEHGVFGVLAAEPSAEEVALPALRRGEIERCREALNGALAELSEKQRADVVTRYWKQEPIPRGGQTMTHTYTKLRGKLRSIKPLVVGG